MKTITPETAAPEPERDCPLCPRLAAFRHEWQAKEPDWFNAPVPLFGPRDARLAIIGLAPGLRGANRTGRPFTGDFAGDLLYATLDKFNFSSGQYDARPDDGVELQDVAIVNAVRCVPPQNKPTGEEIRTCNVFLQGAIAQLPQLKVMIALGKIAHDAVISGFGLTKTHYKFAHAARHHLPNGLTVIDSYHCSRYNTNTGVLTPAMFETVFAHTRQLIPVS